MDENSTPELPAPRDPNTEPTEASRGIRDRLSQIQSSAVERAGESERLQTLQEQARKAANEIRDDPLKAAALPPNDSMN